MNYDLRGSSRILMVLSCSLSAISISPLCLSVSSLSLSLSHTHTHTIHNIFELYSAELPRASLKLVYEILYIFSPYWFSLLLYLRIGLHEPLKSNPLLLTTKPYCLVSVVSGLKKETYVFDRKILKCLVRLWNKYQLLPCTSFRDMFSKGRTCRSQWTRGLRRRSAAARLLR